MAASIRPAFAFSAAQLLAVAVLPAASVSVMKARPKSRSPICSPSFWLDAPLPANALRSLPPKASTLAPVIVEVAPALERTLKFAVLSLAARLPLTTLSGAIGLLPK